MPVSKRQLSTVLPVAFIGVVAAVFVVLAFPRFEAALTALPGDRFEAQLSRGKTLSLTELDRIIDSRRDALRVSPNPELAKELALASHRKWAATAGDARRAAVEQTAEAARMEITALPLAAYGWWRYARAKTVLAGAPGREAVKALLMSIRTQPNAARLMPMRLSTIFRNWIAFSFEERSALSGEILATWKKNRFPTLELARNQAYRVWIRLGIIEADADEIARFDEYLVRFLKKHGLR